MTKRRKGVKGEAATIYGERKERINVSLTKTAIALLDAKAKSQNITRSELLEQLARSLAVASTDSRSE